MASEAHCERRPPADIRAISALRMTIAPAAIAMYVQPHCRVLPFGFQEVLHLRWLDDLPALIARHSLARGGRQIRRIGSQAVQVDPVSGFVFRFRPLGSHLMTLSGVGESMYKDPVPLSGKSVPPLALED